MKAPDDSQTEAFVCSMRWRPLPDEVRATSLAAALAACQPPAAKPIVSLHRRVIAWVPRPVRWTLAACWTLSLGLRLATPAPPAAPAPILAANDNIPPDRALPLFASLEQTNLAIHELQLDIKSPLTR
ncbi:MAG TPA: hypothetical protein VG796_15605 [Verrucomicrobiales bacterium]|nr:hypothetical protein [Verrucomicrobiales bacterium]